MRLFLLTFFLSCTAFAQGPLGFAALPSSWVDNTVCNPPGAYDVTVTLGTTLNIGPNVQGSSVGSPYALNYLGLRDALGNWRDNADNSSQTPHFSDKWWLIIIPAGTNLHGPTNLTTGYDANNALISMPGKVLNSGTKPTKCLVIQSSLPLTPGVMACGRGLPGFGGARNPGCTSPNDKAQMWTVTLDGPLTAVGRNAFYLGEDPQNQSNTLDCYGNAGVGCWVNHVLIHDIEVTMASGASQSGSSVHAPYLFRSDSNVTNAAPPCSVNPCIEPDHVGLDRYYIHGRDPGDSGQPSGACSAWLNNSGSGAGQANVSVSPDGVNVGTSIVTLTLPTPASSYNGAVFGMTFTVGSTITINSTPYVIANTSYTQGALNGSQNTQISIVGNYTISTGTYTQINPPSQYANGCGDDAVSGVIFDCDYCWRQNGYIEKIHWWGSESHASSQGFSNGPYKDVNNWEEGGSAGWFNGGAPVDQRGGPTNDQEVRRNYFGRDLNYRQLSASAGAAPNPPWGCGPIAGAPAKQNTCPFSWAIKNTVELKLGIRVLFDGNIIENSWADGQTGWCTVVGPRTCSGGAACGIYNSSTGLPLTVISDIRFSNNWIRNCPEPFTTGSRSGNIGNGGGVSAPSEDNDYINNLMSNINDLNQTGNPNDQWVWGLGQNTYPCSMSYTGSSNPYTVTAVCQPYQQDITGKITKIASISATGTPCTNFGFSSPCSQVEIYYVERLDPLLCTGGVPATCISAGWTLNVANHSGWNGTFAMTSTSNAFSTSGITGAGDGTGGNNIFYVDAINNPGVATLCDNSGSPTCSSLLNSGDVDFASHGFQITDVAVGDLVNFSNCSTSGYAVTGVPSITGTLQNGLTVVYQVATAPSGPSGTCTLDNSPGFPRFITLQSNSILCPAVCSIQTQSTQLANTNQFFWNVWADNDSGTASYLHCTNPTTPEGTNTGLAGAVCWDPASFEFYQDVVTGRVIGSWPKLDPLNNCPGCVNYAPQSGYTGTGAKTGVNCSGSSPTSGCLGLVGFMNGASATVQFPATSCAATNAPFNCPLMALPWANNFTLADMTYAGGSYYSAYGVNSAQLLTASTQNEYICPSGASCTSGGDHHGPYPDGPSLGPLVPISPSATILAKDKSWSMVGGKQ